MSELKTIAEKLIGGKQGILAADESFPTIKKRFDKIGIESNEANRQSYRDMLFTSPGIGDYISGVILFDETIRQKALDGRTFVEVLNAHGVLPGIKVDQGTLKMGDGQEKVTTGLDGLEDRLADYASLGAKFTKWRAVITISDATPTDQNLRINAKDLAVFAKKTQEAGMVPMVEPEVLMDGSHSMERCAEVSEKTLRFVFEALGEAGVDSPGMILKTNMVVPGKLSGQTASSIEIAKATTAMFNKILPQELPGVAFLSGGQSEIEATENLNAINLAKTGKWFMNFSYGRALQDSALTTWAGKKENIVAAQEKFLHRAKMNSLAVMGRYAKDLEK